MKVKIMQTDISHLLTSCTWSGSRLNVARKLEFSFVQDDRDANIPVVDVDNGRTCYGYDDADNLVFEGNIYSIERDRAKSSVSVTAFDHLYVLAKSKTTRKFDDITPEDVARQVCVELGVLVGDIAETGTAVSFIANAKTGYQIIQGAYTEAAKVTGKKYHPIMSGAKLDVIEKGTLIEGYTADSAVNMEDSVYKESIENLVDQVLVVDEEGNRVDYVRNDEHIKKYSLFQEVYKQDPNKDTQTEAKALLTKPERSGYITALGDYRVKSSYSIIVKDSLFKGKFWIKSDTHTFVDGKHEMKLELEFENLMNEEESEKEKEEKEQ
nr:MAG TPA: 43 kDa tail protein [Caudoviricetes sp.]